MVDGEKDYRFAKRCGINPTTMSLFLSGKRLPNTKNITQICEATGVTMDWLVKGVGDKYSPPPDKVSIIIDRGPGQDPEIAEAVRLGQSTTRPLNDRDLAALAASYIIDSGLPKNDRERLADLVREAFADPELLRLLLDAADLHFFRRKNGGEPPSKKD